MPSEAWTSIAIQIPVVLLFCIFMGYIVKQFLGHINSQEQRTRDFIKEQRESNNTTAKDVADAHAVAVKELAIAQASAIKDLVTEHKESMAKLTDGIRDDLTGISTCLSSMNASAAGHDAFVRSAWRGKYGDAAMTAAEQAGEVAQAQAKR